jgi:hypothetical protein
MDRLSSETLWNTHFPEFVRVGEAAINSLMASAKLAY